jgi:PAS domain S-box-containing protein
VLADVNASLESGNPVLIDFHRMPATYHNYLYAVAPLRMRADGTEKPVGAVLLSIDAEDYLYPLIQSWPVPSETAETLLVEREGDHILFLNELRHRNNTALNLTIPLTQTTLPAVMAVQGKTGAFEGTDYRGAEVISVLEPVSGSPWFIVAKVDTDEAYSLWRSRSLLIIAGVAGSLASAFVIIGLVWQRRQKYYYRTLYATQAERVQDERRNRERLETQLRLAEMESASEQELADFVLEAGCRLTDSQHAFIGMMSPDSTGFDILSWSKSAMKDCSVADSPTHFPINNAGIWAEAVRQQKPCIVNAYPAEHPEKKGLPPGHLPISRFVTVPISDGQRVVMVFAVANKDAEYTELDVENLTLLLQGIWNHIRKRSADEAIRKKTRDLEAAYEEIAANDEKLTANYAELTRSQKAVEESERKYRNLYRFAQVGLFETSLKDATVVACNKRYADLAGFLSVEDAIGKDILHLYSNPEDRFEVSRILRTQGYIENHVVRFRNQSTGAEFWGQFSARYNNERDVAEGSIIDVTEQKVAERRLHESEERLLMAQEIGHIGAWEYNLQTGKIWGSAEGARIYGLPPVPGDFPLDRIEACIPEHERVHQALIDLINGKDDYNLEFIINPANGAPQKVIISVARLEKDGAGKPIRVMGIIQDITERKQIEHQREELIAELEKKITELERFTYTVSHDLKSPLITIKGFAGMVDDDARKGDMPQLKKDLGRITDAAETLEALLSDLLELSRIGKVVNPFTPVPLGTIVHEARDLLAGPLAERGVRVEIDPELPVVMVDHARIREAIINLMENAIKFSGDRRDPRIRIGVEYDGKTPVFFVKDNGIGINPNYLGRIFNLFERLSPSVQGTGIGLPITRRIIEAHGGEIWAESEGVGKGTTLWFTLPPGGLQVTDNNNNGQIKE